MREVGYNLSLLAGDCDRGWSRELKHAMWVSASDDDNRCFTVIGWRELSATSDRRQSESVVLTQPRHISVCRLPINVV